MTAGPSTNERGRRRTGQGLMVLAAMTLGLPGCVDFFRQGLTPGTYEGDVSCTINVTTPEGMTGEDQFTNTYLLVVGDDGVLNVNGEDIAVGEQVARSIPTADLAFEVIDLVTTIGRVVVTYEPRPTLPGITIDGELIERYERTIEGVEVTASADLDLVDVEGTSRFELQCRGVLAVRDDP